jgi:hypothetical protein
MQTSGGEKIWLETFLTSTLVTESFTPRPLNPGKVPEPGWAPQAGWTMSGREKSFISGICFLVLGLLEEILMRLRRQFLSIQIIQRTGKGK